MQLASIPICATTGQIAGPFVISLLIVDGDFGPMLITVATLNIITIGVVFFGKSLAKSNENCVESVGA